MVKKSANPWLRGLLRAGKQQQRTVSRALSALLAVPKPAPKAKAKAIPKPKPKPTPKPKSAPAKKAAPARPKAAPARPTRTALDPVAPASGKWLASHYTGQPDHGAGAMRRMSYWLYIPDTPPARTGLPLVVMLHGCDQSATLFAQGTRMNHWAEKQGYAVLYPQQSVSAHPHRCWKWYDRATQHGGGDVSLIVGIVNKVAGTYPIDRARIYICGISAGAGMANIVALNHPDLFAALGMHSGPLFGAGHSTVGALGVMQHGASSRVDSAIAEVLFKRPGFPPLPTILFQGEEDTVVRPVNQAQLTRQAMLLNRLPHGSPVDMSSKVGTKSSHPYRVHDVYSDRRLMLRVAQIAELKHAWSGGDERLSYNSGAGPDASKMLLDFFSKHRRSIG
ncbi:extracellular catalytic domain type 1 short-chain-length polyhydroxyalkanoate depolymerase [Massilia sp. TWP1-3-3]|uniref:extracellular catalytic domain type 1 short-chain-length polyhydroxyalkanoate depolymerase n=1 Tax=Massilia sp. TWP1-3-3 TaxID=2804573 RepID=UPI003CE79D72